VEMAVVADCRSGVAPGECSIRRITASIFASERVVETCDGAKTGLAARGCSNRSPFAVRVIDHPRASHSRTR
ncbi:MAG: hypothetical protein ACLGIM_10060, partial [Alphaproteobacteria bacterium]